MKYFLWTIFLGPLFNVVAQSEQIPAAKDYCVTIGPVALTIHGDSINGRYCIRVTPEPIYGTIAGTIREGLADAIWTDEEGTGRIIFGFSEDLTQFRAMFNSTKTPAQWWDGWKGALASTVNTLPEDRKKSLICDWPREKK